MKTVENPTFAAKLLGTAGDNVGRANDLVFGGFNGIASLKPDQSGPSLNEGVSADKAFRGDALWRPARPARGS